MQQTIAAVAAGLILARWAASLWLSQLNRRHVLAHAGVIPPVFVGMIDEPTYEKSVSYTLARNRFSQVAQTYGTLVLVAVLFSGVLPGAYELTQRSVGTGTWAMGVFILSMALAISFVGLPLGWVAQFWLEERFGFNTSNQRIWWTDLAKRLLLGIALGYPLVVLTLQIVEWAGSSWWVWAWGTMMAFQLLITAVAPFLILPLFNKLTPLPEGPLEERLHALAKKTRFRARSIQVMDGSRRSRHSNAFFTGFGAFRKIVLFDTLIEQMDEPEIEAVLAHEIGHSKRRHISKMLVSSAAGALVGFWLVSWIAMQPQFVEAFGFASSTSGSRFTAATLAPVLLLFGLLAGTATFWLNPLIHWTSRKYEYEADAFALQVIGEATPMVGALRKLTEKNLSNLTPHPLYSRFYYSHPTLLEREAALEAM